MFFKVKAEHKEFIKSQTLKGHGPSFIKKELDRVFSREITPSLRTVERYINCVKATERGSAYNPNSSTLNMNKNYYKFIEKCVNEGQPQAWVIKEMTKKFGKHAPCKMTIREWYARFKCAAESRNNHTSTQQPAGSNDAIARREPSRNVSTRRSERLKLRNEPEIILIENGIDSNEPECILIEDSFDSIDNSPETTSQLEDDDQNGSESESGLDEVLEPEKILGDAFLNGKRWFMVKCKNRSTDELCKFL